MIFTWVTEATARSIEVVVSVEADRPLNGEKKPESLLSFRTT